MSDECPCGECKAARRAKVRPAPPIDAKYEYAVFHARLLANPHRSGMTEAEARQWIDEWHEMGGGRHIFRISRRWVGDWEEVA